MGQIILRLFQLLKCNPQTPKETAPIAMATTSKGTMAFVHTQHLSLIMISVQ